jgi:hypothetical protein
MARPHFLCQLPDGSAIRKLITDIAPEGRYSKENSWGSTASGSHTRRIFFPRSMTCKERPGCGFSIHVLKYALATLVQGVALALRYQLPKHASHCVYSIHEIIQLRKLSLG